MKTARRIHRLYVLALAGAALVTAPLAVQADETSTEFAIVPLEVPAITDTVPDAVTAEVVAVEAMPSDASVTTDSVVEDVPALRLAMADDGEKPLLGTVETEETVRAHITSPYVFEKGDRECDFSIGYGSKIQVHRFDGRSDVDIIQALPRWGRFRNAKQEILWEVPITYFTGDESGFLGGLTLMFRQHLTKNRRFMPYVEFGPGVTLTSLKIPELGGAFQFSLQGGVGLRKALSEGSDLVIGARWYHLSNAGTRSPNTGLNNYLITVGYSKLY